MAQLATGVPLAAVAIGALLVTYPEVIPWQTNYTLFLHGIEQAPRASRPWQLMGDLYANKGDHKKALMYLERAHSLEPQNDNIVYFYAEQLHAVGAYEGELALLRDAAKENPTSEQTWVMYLVALGTRRGPDSVLAELARVPAHDSTSLNWHAVMKGEAFCNKDMPDSAIAAYRAALVQQPQQRQPALSAREHAAADRKDYGGGDGARDRGLAQGRAPRGAAPHALGDRARARRQRRPRGRRSPGDQARAPGQLAGDVPESLGRAS